MTDLRHRPPVNTPTAADPRPPLLSLLFGYGPMLVIVALAAAAWIGVAHAAEAARLWAAAILLFLAGVTRGLSFFTETGPRLSQLVVMGARFGLGVLALAIWLPGAFVALILGYLTVALYDPRAARTGAAPRHFAALRPPQSAVALVGLAALLLHALA